MRQSSTSEATQVVAAWYQVSRSSGSAVPAEIAAPVYPVTVMRRAGFPS
jgi:hypothetical protein